MADNEVFADWMRGEHPVEIAKRLDVPVLDVLNAIQRYHQTYVIGGADV